MAKVTLRPGETYDILSGAEFGHHLRGFRAGVVDDILREEYRGIKYVRPQPVQAIITSGTSFTAFIPGPQSGFMWQVRRVSNYGIAATDANAAVLNLFRSTDESWHARNFLGQLPANDAWLPGTKSVFLLPDENLYVVGNGITTATASIAFSAEVIEVPAERFGAMV